MRIKFRSSYVLLLALLLLLRSSQAHAQTDAIPVSDIEFVGPGGNIGAFPVTTAITRVEIGLKGVSVEFTKKDGPNRWPDTKDMESAGGMGPLQYSVGLVIQVNGRWYASAPIEFWYGRGPEGTGQIQDQTVTCASGQGQIHCNWFYAPDRWPHLFDARPQAGETLGLFVVYGDARNNMYTSASGQVIHERSNIVTFQLPATGQAAVFDYGVTPPSHPHPTCETNPALCLPPSAPDLQALTNRVFNLEERATRAEQALGQAADKINQLVEAVNGLRDTLASVVADVTALRARPIPASCSASINLVGARVPLSCKLNP
jgi:hypothetical protein